MPRDCHPNRMSFDDRMTEVAGIQAAGILHKRRREMNQLTEDRSPAISGLDVFAQKSVHCTEPLPKGESR